MGYDFDDDDFDLPIAHRGPDAAGSSRAFEAMRREVGSLRDDALVKERKYADLWGAAEPNGWTNHVAAYDEVLAVIDELEELS